MLSDGNDDYLNRRYHRGQDKTVVVAVGHDDAAYDAGGQAPAGLMGIGLLVVFVGKGDVERAGEAVAEIVAGSGLERLVVVHHALDGVCALGTGELFLVGLVAAHDGHGKEVLAAVGIDLEHLLGLFNGLLRCCVEGVALLPEELAAAQERAGGLFPAENGAPLVIFHRQIAPGMNDVAPVVAEQRLAGRADAQTLGQFLASAVSDPCALGREALDMVLFLLKQALGDQNGHGDVFMSKLLEAPVQIVHDILPDGIAVGTQNKQALDSGVVNELRLGADVREPLGKVDLHIGYLFNFLLFRHLY